MPPVANKMREAKFRWFGHVKMRFADELVRRPERLAILRVRRGKGVGVGIK